MSIGIGPSNLLQYNQVSNQDSSEKLEQTLSSGLENADDEKMLEACKSFETYFVEQVIKEMEKTVHSSDDNKYTEYFGDMLYEEYANNISESGELGIAQMLYESMKRQ